MKKFIIVVDGKVGTRYTYNLWEVFYYDDGSVSENNRVLHGDNLDEFIKVLKEKIEASVPNKEQE